MCDEMFELKKDKNKNEGLVFKKIRKPDKK